MKCHNIEDQNKYFFNLSKAVELEDADDEFITEDELKDMGIRYQYGGFTMFEAKIKREIKKWVKQIPTGGTVTCTDDELIEVLKQYHSQCGGGVADMLDQQRGKVGGVQRAGNKFKLRGKAKVGKKAKRNLLKTDWFKLMHIAKVALNEYGLCIDGIDVPDRHLTLRSIKKVVRWCDMVDASKKGWYDSQYYKQHANKEDMAMVRRMWFKPEIVTDFGRKK